MDILNKSLASPVQAVLGAKTPTYRFIVSTDDEDRDGDIVKQDGWDFNEFNNNPIALLQHKHDQPVGKWSNITTRKRDNGGYETVADLTLAPPVSDLLKYASALVEANILNATSVGFQVKAFDRRKSADGKPMRGHIIHKALLREISLVSVPANQNAIRIAKEIGVSKDVVKSFVNLDIADSSVDVDDDEPTPTSLALDKANSILAGHKPQLKTKSTQKELSTMTIAQKIESAKKAVVAKKDELAELATKAADGEQVEASVIETLTKSIEEDQAKIDSLEKAEQILVAKTAPAFTKNYSDKEGQYDFAKSAVVQLKSFIDRVSPEQAAAELYGSDSAVMAVTKAMKNKAADATLVATTGQAGWAAELTRQAYGSFVDSLKAVSIAPQLSARGLSLNFGGAQYITFPVRGSTPTLAGAFVGEGQSIPVKKTAFSAGRFDRYKMGVISVMSKEITERSTPQIEALVREAILYDTGEALDAALIDANASVAGIRPAGLLNGVTATESTATTAAEFMADLRAAITPMIQANAFRKPVILMGPSLNLGLSQLMNATGQFVFANELASGRLQGMDVIVSTRVPAGEAIIVDAADFASAFDTPTFYVSDTATLAVDSAPETPAAGTYSLYQQDLLAVRMLLPTAWGMMRSGEVAHITGLEGI